jgi:hypothetical protein
MRKMLVLAAVVAALGMVSQPTEARDRGFGFRHFSGHAVSKLHLGNPGFKFHHGGFVGSLDLSSRGTSGTSTTVVSHSSSGMPDTSSRGTSDISGSGGWC